MQPYHYEGGASTTATSDQVPVMTLNKHIIENRGSYFFALFLVGTLNNNAYTLV
jgi:hypothetical protein